MLAKRLTFEVVGVDTGAADFLVALYLTGVEGSISMQIKTDKIVALNIFFVGLSPGKVSVQAFTRYNPYF